MILFVWMRHQGVFKNILGYLLFLQGVIGSKKYLDSVGVLNVQNPAVFQIRLIT
jgi:hypothetical protein